MLGRGMSRDGAITVLLADDHAMVRSGLRALLDAQSDLEVVGEAGTVDEAVALTLALRPAVLVLDLGMPRAADGRSSLDVVPRLAREAPATRVVILTMEDDPEYARRALSTGATGYVLKEAVHGELVAAIRRAVDGEAYLNPRLGAALATAAAVPATPPDDLTERETEILRLVALGYTNAEIGRLLHLSVRTIEARRAHVQQKLGAGSRPELVRYALERGLLDDAV
jgi:DNA-binding NarL/FixJ family response regulator